MKWFRTAVVAVMLVNALVVQYSSSAQAASKMSITYNGQLIEGADPIVEQGRTLIPFSLLLRAMDIPYQWNQASKTLVIESAGTKVTLKLGQKTVDVNGVKVKLDTAPVAIQGRTYVPVRFIADQFGVKIDYDQRSNTVKLTTREDWIAGSPTSLVFVAAPSSLKVAEYKMSRLPIHQETDSADLEAVSLVIQLLNQSDRSIPLSDIEYEIVAANNQTPLASGVLSQLTDMKIAAGEKIQVHLFCNAKTTERLTLKLKLAQS